MIYQASLGITLEPSCKTFLPLNKPTMRSLLAIALMLPSVVCLRPQDVSVKTYLHFMQHVKPMLDRRGIHDSVEVGLHTNTVDGHVLVMCHLPENIVVGLCFRQGQTIQNICLAAT